VVFRAGRASFIRVHDPAPVFWSLMIRFPEDNNGSPDPVERVTRRRRYGVSGGFLYAQSGGSGSVKAFAVSADGSLAPIGSWTIPDGSSQEGIAAS